ncbi:MAG: hypothetical protein KGJ84_13575 [Elusimicrobia bacterium]|nr:hypothetical protein [Elusimicrobiota bacterium]
MSVQLTAASPRVTVSVSADDDPFKKYWWLILVGFVLTGLWLCLPGMEASVGSAHVDTSKPVAGATSEQSLDSVDNPAGAEGGALDLSMDGAGKRKDKGVESFESMLYQPPPEPGAAAPGAPLGASAGSASLAQQLKSVGGAKAKDASGWDEKARTGFASPHLSGSGLSGAGSSSGGSSASASAGGGAFGSSNAQISFGNTHGLKDDGGESASAGGLAALRTAAKTAGAAAASRSNDAARAGVGSFFDGSKGRSAGIAGDAGGSGTYAELDAAPANLKANNPDLNKKEIKAPPSTPAPASADNQMGKQLLMMAATAVIGGMIPGVGGQMVMMAGMMLMQQQQAKADAAAQQQQQAASNRMNGVVSGH